MEHPTDEPKTITQLVLTDQSRVVVAIFLDEDLMANRYQPLEAWSARVRDRDHGCFARATASNPTTRSFCDTS